jgi:hypothetical protein
MCCVFAHASHATSYGPGPSAHLLLPTTVLQPLQHLTRLHLQVLPSTDGVVQHIGSMTDLQDLRLGAINEGTVLQLTIPQLTALTKLRRLGLQGASLRCGTPAEAAANVAALLAWLPMLQELSSLQLRDVVGLVPAPQSYDDASSDDDSSPDVAHYPPPSAYSALTAGSALQHIDLRATWISRSVWQHAFPRERKFTCITSLRLHVRHLTTHITRVAFEAAVSACPELQELHVYELDSNQVQALQQLTCLTRLSVGYATWDTLRLVVTQLTQLKSLWLLDLLAQSSLQVSYCFCCMLQNSKLA